MVRAFGVCAGIAFTAACGLSEEYALPTGGAGAGISGGNGIGGSGVNAGTGNTGNTTGGNGVNGTVGSSNGGPPGTSGGNNGNGPGGNGPGGNGTAGNGPGGSGTAGNGPGGSIGTGTGNGGSIGTTGGMGSTSGGGGGACATELEPCSAKADCCANLTCEKEPSAGGSFCESSCKTSGCANAQTVCTGGTCVLDICGGNSGNGSYNSTCSAGGQAGTCQPKMPGMDEYGICFVGGTADGGGCSETAPTTDPSQLCIAGEFCGNNPSGPGEECHVICDPGLGRGGTAVCKAAGYTTCVATNGDEGECLNF